MKLENLKFIILSTSGCSLSHPAFTLLFTSSDVLYRAEIYLIRRSLLALISYFRLCSLFSSATITPLLCTASDKLSSPCFHNLLCYSSIFHPHPQSASRYVQFNLVHFSFIYIEPNHSNSCLKSLYFFYQLISKYQFFDRPGGYSFWFWSLWGPLNQNSFKYPAGGDSSDLFGYKYVGKQRLASLIHNLSEHSYPHWWKCSVQNGWVMSQWQPYFIYSLLITDFQF